MSEMCGMVSFSGADVITYIGNKAMGEIASVRWRKNLDILKGPNQIEGKIETVVFNDRIPLQDYQGKKFDIVLKYLNEYGGGKIIFIEDAQLTEVEGGIGVDEVIEEVSYLFKAKDVMSLPYHLHVEDKIKFIKENDGCDDKGNCKLIEFYKDDMLRSVVEEQTVIVPKWEYKALREEVKALDKYRKLMEHMEDLTGKKEE